MPAASVSRFWPGSDRRRTHKRGSLDLRIRRSARRRDLQAARLPPPHGRGAFRSRQVPESLRRTKVASPRRHRRPCGIAISHRPATLPRGRSVSRPRRRGRAPRSMFLIGTGHGPTAPGRRPTPLRRGAVNCRRSVAESHRHCSVVLPRQRACSKRPVRHRPRHMNRTAERFSRPAIAIATWPGREPRLARHGTMPRELPGRSAPSARGGRLGRRLYHRFALGRRFVQIAGIVVEKRPVIAHGVEQFAGIGRLSSVESLTAVPQRFVSGGRDLLLPLSLRVRIVADARAARPLFVRLPPPTCGPAPPWRDCGRPRTCSSLPLSRRRAPDRVVEFWPATDRAPAPRLRPYTDA